jgi:hypothetical protein
VYDHYPECEQGLKALYAAAWINDKDLGNNKTAFKLYKMLCDSFPKSDICLSNVMPIIKTVEDSLAARKARKTADALPGAKPKKGHKTGGTPHDTAAVANPKVNSPSLPKAIGAGQGPAGAGPSTNAATPSTNAATPSTNAATPSTNAATPSTNAATPSTNATTPSTNATTPSTNATTPSTNATSSNAVLQNADTTKAAAKPGNAVADTGGVKKQ